MGCPTKLIGKSVIMEVTVTDSTPEVMPLAVDPDEHLIQVPASV